MQEHKTIQSFLDVVAEQIRWKRARPVVTAELERHLEDQRDAFAEEGLENAEELAVEEMGDPVSVGTELDRARRKILCKQYSTKVKNGAGKQGGFWPESLDYRKPWRSERYARRHGVNDGLAAVAY